MNGLSSAQKIVTWIFQIVAALILARAAYGKFAGMEMSIYIFEQLAMGTSGRFIIGLIEAFAALMLLTPVVPHFGAILGFGTMMGALIAHCTILGLEVQGDGGMLVAMMCMVVFTTSGVMYIWRKDLPLIGRVHED